MWPVPTDSWKADTESWFGVHTTLPYRHSKYSLIPLILSCILTCIMHVKTIFYTVHNSNLKISYWECTCTVFRFTFRLPANLHERWCLWMFCLLIFGYFLDINIMFSFWGSNCWVYLVNICPLAHRSFISMSKFIWFLKLL